MIRVIGICGAARAGKTTFADFVQERLAEEAFILRRVAFADPVKAIARMFGWRGEKDEKGRRLLQLIGTECGRECIGPDVWVDRWLEMVGDEVYCDGFVAIADDVRFPNEAAAIRKLGGTIFRVTRPGCEPSDHPSERDDIAADHTIANVGTVEELRTAAHAWAMHLAAP